jgi:hypothetical protein
MFAGWTVLLPTYAATTSVVIFKILARLLSPSAPAFICNRPNLVRPDYEKSHIVFTVSNKCENFYSIY